MTAGLRQAGAEPSASQSTPDQVVVRPNAAALIESMRAFGYSPPTAIADLVDNSISAGARTIRVDFHWDGAESHASVSDDGAGMDEAQLTDAMRLGSRSPREARAAGDLGRFGLGLKTASFSQCRSLTVASRPSGGQVALRRWTLDHVEHEGEWLLLTTPAPDSQALLSPLERAPSGTIVLWQQLDRAVGNVTVDDHAAHDRFRSLIAGVEEHLAMVFHRFLEGPRAVTLWINDRRIAPWDPFLASEPATRSLPRETLTLGDQRVDVTPYVLPHHSKLSTETHARASGIGGWNAHQGFYVYRGNRLLVPGDWLRLGYQKEEHCKLARIRVDLPNSMDAAWQIDVRKATARPPGPLRDDLRRMAEVTRREAIAIYRHRGKVIARSASKEHAFVWRQRLHRGRVSYTINRGNPLLARALRTDPELESILRLIEETIPAPMIVLDAAERPDQQAAPFELASTTEISTLAQRVYDALRGEDLDDEAARRGLLTMEPFNQYPEVIAELEIRP